MLTARDAVEDRITGLDPRGRLPGRSLRISRIARSLLPACARSSELRPAKITVADLVLDTPRKAFPRGRSISLTAKEYALVEFLAAMRVGRADNRGTFWMKPSIFFEFNRGFT